MTTPQIVPIIALLFTLQTFTLALGNEAPLPSSVSGPGNLPVSDPRNDGPTPVHRDPASSSKFNSCVAQLRKTTQAALHKLIESNEIEEISGGARKWREYFIERYPEYSDLPEEEIKRIFYEVLVSGEAYMEAIFSVGDLSLVKFVNIEGQIILKMRLPSEGGLFEGIPYDRILTVDSKTQAIEANTTEGRLLTEAFVRYSVHGTIVIFADLNFLGKVNYFEKSYSAGDEYLIAFGEAMRRNLRLGKGGDLMLKIGGDEFVFLIPISEGYLEQPQAVQAFMDRLVQSVRHSREACAVFSEQKRALAKEYRILRAANSFADLPDSFLLSALGNEFSISIASMNFSGFKEAYLARQFAKIVDQARFVASVSVGAAVVLPGAAYGTGLESAREDARLFKLDYKKRLGFSGGDLDKYGNQGHQTPSLPTPSNTGQQDSENQRRRRLDIGPPRSISPQIIKPRYPGS